jgi:murein DD-endopeptidase MepM/ murein hydrolase activator NlpD
MLSRQAKRNLIPVWLMLVGCLDKPSQPVQRKDDEKGAAPQPAPTGSFEQAPPERVVTALTRTFLKKRNDDSSKLDVAEKCEIAQGTKLVLQAAPGAAVRQHWAIELQTKLEGCELTSGFLFANHWSQGAKVDSGKSSDLSSSGFVWPTQGRQIRNDAGGSGEYGAPRSSGKGHQGIDIVASVGEEIIAAREGTIIDPAFEASYGNVVDVQHSGGYLSRYAHLTSFAYSHGTYVEQGAKIATSGRTGNASGPTITPHLHFEIRKDGSTLNPLKQLP